MKNRLALFFVFLFLSTGVYAQHHSDWSYNLGMYEVNVRQYSSAGTFAAFQNDLDRVEDLGVGILWFMPIHPIGQENRLGSLGSYYSVQNFLEVNPNYGTMEDFKALVNDIHSRGMYVVIDWVANHTSWDNVLTETHPEWYVTNSNGEFIPPPGTNWSDVIELDYTQQGLRDYMVDAMKFWVDSVGVDGFRFDAVSFVPDDFWVEALAELKAAKPDIFLLAEGPEASLHDLGFHMNYAWSFYGFGGGVTKEILTNSYPGNLFRTYVDAEKADYSNGEYRLYFVSNHDENSWEGTPYELFGGAAENFAVLSQVINGMPLIYNGEEAGMNKRLAFFDKDLIPWKSHKNFGIYQSLLDLRRRNPALWSGYDENEAERILTSNNPDIYAFKREMNGEHVFALFNFTPEEHTIAITGAGIDGEYTDVITNDISTIATGDSISLPSWGYRVLEYRNPLSTEETADGVTGYTLDQNYPNPFNPSTTISFTLADPVQVKVTVYDITGKEVAVLTDRRYAQGSHSLTFNAGNLSTGVYYYRLETPEFTATKKLTLIK